MRFVDLPFSLPGADTSAKSEAQRRMFGGDGSCFVPPNN